MTLTVPFCASPPSLPPVSPVFLPVDPALRLPVRLRVSGRLSASGQLSAAFAIPVAAGVDVCCFGSAASDPVSLLLERRVCPPPPPTVITSPCFIVSLSTASSVPLKPLLVLLGSTSGRLAVFGSSGSPSKALWLRVCRPPALVLPRPSLAVRLEEEAEGDWPLPPRLLPSSWPP